MNTSRKYELAKDREYNGKTRGGSKSGGSSAEVPKDEDEGRKKYENRLKTIITCHGCSEQGHILGY